MKIVHNKANFSYQAEIRFRQPKAPVHIRDRPVSPPLTHKIPGRQFRPGILAMRRRIENSPYSSSGSFIVW